MNNNKVFLPIGTICRLKDGEKNVMITGFCPVVNEGELYDYCGCIYPVGVISPTMNFVFNNDKIEEIIFKGFENDDEKKFKTELSKFLATNDIQKFIDEQKNENQAIEVSQSQMMDSQPNLQTQSVLDQNVISQSVVESQQFQQPAVDQNVVMQQQPAVDQNVVMQQQPAVDQNVVMQQQPVVESEQPGVNTNPIDLFGSLPTQPNINDFMNNQ